MKQFLSALAMIAMTCLPAVGEEVAFSFRGTVHELDGEFSYFTGQTFEIIYSFERTQDDVDFGDPRSGSYPGVIKSGRLTISRGDETLTWVVESGGPHNFIQVKNLDAADFYSAGVSVSGPVGRDAIPASFTIELIDGDSAALNSDELPTALEVESFRRQKIVRFSFKGTDQNVYSTVGVITSADTPVAPSTGR